MMENQEVCATRNVCPLAKFIVSWRKGLKIEQCEHDFFYKNSNRKKMFSGYSNFLINPGAIFLI